VDDEKSVRRPLRRALEYCGYEVVEAGDGLEALLVHSRHRDRIRLALLDVKMPRMSGWEVLAELKQREPSLPVILTSGYSKEESTPPAGAVMPDAFLNKPYELVDLAHIVRRLMEKN
jgi:CheY-like chemotaxis protein